MAIDKDVWNEAKFLWELDKPLAYIVKKTGISKGQISKKSKAENWEKETKGNELKPLIKAYDKEKETLERKGNDIVSKLCTLEDFQITLLDKVIEDETGNKSLLFSTANLALIRSNQHLTKNTKQELVKVNNYVDGRLDSQSVEVIEVPLDSTDIKNYIDAIDKASITLKVNERFAPKIEVNNTNAQQNIDNTLEIKFQRIDIDNNK